MKYYKILLGQKVFELTELTYGFLFWSPIYRDVDYLVCDLPAYMLTGGEDQLNSRFTYREAKDHIERLKLKEKYVVVKIIESVKNEELIEKNRCINGYKQKFQDEIQLS